jgi:hypothetical protein
MGNVEGLPVIDAELAAGWPPGRVGIVDGEGRNAGRGDADIEAPGSAVVIFLPLLDRSFAQAVRQDGALAGTLGFNGLVGRLDGGLVGAFNGGNFKHGFSAPSGLGPRPGLLLLGLASGSQRPGRYFDETAMPPRNDDSAEVLVLKSLLWFTLLHHAAK